MENKTRCPGGHRDLHYTPWADLSFSLNLDKSFNLRPTAHTIKVWILDLRFPKLLPNSKILILAFFSHTWRFK